MVSGAGVAPDNTAERVALWRALHLEVDDKPPVFVDQLGLQIANPAEGWRDRGDMHPEGTKSFRASILARARFIEELLFTKVEMGVEQYVILGAGLDTFAQREPKAASHLNIFEIDRPGPQQWKKQRLNELRWEIPSHLHFVPVDFEAGDNWWERLLASGFDASEPAVVSSTGVSMYLSKEANAATLKQLSQLAKGSVFAMSFLLPFDQADPEIRPGLEMSEKGARASGTPFISFYEPKELIDSALEIGFRMAEHISSELLAEIYFEGRKDGLRPPRNAEGLLLVRT